MIPSAYLIRALRHPQRRAPELTSSRPAIPIPPSPPCYGRTLLGRSQLSTAPDLLALRKKRLLVTTVTETHAGFALPKRIGNGNGRAPD